jgi:hypothetical protein
MCCLEALLSLNLFSGIETNVEWQLSFVQSESTFGALCLVDCSARTIAPHTVELCFGLDQPADNVVLSNFFG